MTDFCFRRLFSRLTQAVFLSLVTGSVYILREVLAMRENAVFAMRFWHSVPFQMEHVLGGAAVYFAFAWLLARLRSDNGDAI